MSITYRLGFTRHKPTPNLRITSSNLKTSEPDSTGSPDSTILNRTHLVLSPPTHRFAATADRGFARQGLGGTALADALRSADPVNDRRGQRVSGSFGVSVFSR